MKLPGGRKLQLKERRYYHLVPDWRRQVAPPVCYHSGSLLSGLSLICLHLRKTYKRAHIRKRCKDTTYRKYFLQSRTGHRSQSYVTDSWIWSVDPSVVTDILRDSIVSKGKFNSKCFYSHITYCRFGSKQFSAVKKFARRGLSVSREQIVSAIMKCNTAITSHKS